MKTKAMKRVRLLLAAIIGLTLSSSLASPALGISPGETIEFHVSVDPDYYSHANAHASLYYYGTYTQYVRVDVSWGKEGVGGAIMYFQIGKEFTIIETNHPNPEDHISVAWHPWWTFGFPVYGEGSRIRDESILPAYIASYYFIAKRVDYSSSDCWAELMVSVRTTYGWDTDTDFQILDLPPQSGCVAEGTLVTMADGTSKPVEEIKKGDQVLGFDPTTGSYMVENVLDVTKTNMVAMVVINNGMLKLTPTDQPIFIRNATYEGWVRDPATIEVGWEIFNATSGTWVPVTSITIEEGKTRVYDLTLDGYTTYIANSILLMDKC